MSDPIIVNKKLFQEDPHKHCNPWEASAPSQYRSPVDHSHQGQFGKFLRLFALMDLFQVRHLSFQNRMPKITKNAKERERRLIQNI